MSGDPLVGVLAAAACGGAGVAVPGVVRRLPGPAGAVGRSSALRRQAVLLGAVAGGVVGWAVGLDGPLLFLLPLVPVGAALGLIDARTHLLPTRLIWPSLGVTAALAGAVAIGSGEGAAYLRALLAAAVVLAVCHALWWLQPEGLGYGDVRLATLLAFPLGYLGWGSVLLGVYGAFVVFAVVGLGRALARRDRGALREPLPFGPFLLVGAVVAVAVHGLG